MELVYGSPTYSTWSLRAWLVVKKTGLAFTERVIELHAPDAAAQLARHSPSGFVPVLVVDGNKIWDSLAISLWCAERFPRLWPADATARGYAYSLTCEMHSGFLGLRSACGMGVNHPMVGDGRSPAPQTPELEQDLRRLVSEWSAMRKRFGSDGPYLFGRWSIADAAFTPIATRVRHYQLDLAAYGDDGTALAYLGALLAEPDFLEWETLARAS